MRYRLTCARRDNTATLFTAGASTSVEVALLIDNMRRFSTEPRVITIHDTETGSVETKIIGAN